MRPILFRRARIGAGIAVVLAGLLLFLVAAFPYGLLKGAVERRLSARIGRPVTIASLDRVDTIGFHPTLAIRGLVIPQPAWAGPGDMVQLAEGRATLSIWPLLLGRFAPSDLTVRGLRLSLVRRADGVTNWGGRGDGGGGPGGLARVSVADAVVLYRDAVRDRQVTARVAIDPAAGLRIDGSGAVMGTPVTLTVRGAATGPARAWPFTARIAGPALTMQARGTADRPLDLDHMSLDMTARSADLRLVDAVIEAGLIGTQPVDLAAHVRRDRPGWTITGLNGTIGRSTRIAGDLTVTAADGRHRLAGHLTAPTLAFDDLASDAGRAEAAALTARIGPRLVPDLKINLAKLARTDGRIDFRVDRIVSAQPSSLAAMRGTLVLDHQRLVVDPFALDLTQGAITGRATVAQGGRPMPTLALDLALAHSSITTLAGGHDRVTGTVTARARLTGAGATIRDAVGASDGSISFVARDGVLPARLAAELGFDAGGALVAGGDAQAGLRCVVLRLAVRHGRGTLDPALVVDTTQSRLTGTGTITFPSEALAIRLTGAPKHDALLRLPGAASIAGTIREPQVIVPHEVKSVGNIFKAIGRAIKGTQGPIATDADCGALARAALR